MMARVRAPRAMAGRPAVFWRVRAATLLSWCSRLLVPFLAPYRSAALGWHRHDVSLGIAAYGAGSIVSVLAGGALADHVGRRRTIVAARHSTAVATLLLQGLFAVTWPVAVVLGPLLGSAALDRGGPTLLWGSCGALGLITAGLRLAIAGEQQRRLVATIPAVPQ
jgi:predicted MFS family arabinose efflux permease